MLKGPSMDKPTTVTRLERSRCVVCGSADAAAFGEQTHEGHLFHYARCRNCGMVLVRDPVAVDEPPPKVAPEASTATPRPQRAPQRFRPRPGHHYLAAALAPLVNALPPGRTVLDVGCGRGELAVLVRPRIESSVTYLALEPHRSYAETAMGRGVDVRMQSLEQFADDPASRGAWDLVVMDNMLEHTPDPGDVITKAKALLRPDGALVIAVPNLNDIRRYLPGRFNMWIPAVHINYFSAGTLTRLLRAQGLRPEYLQASVAGAPLKWRLAWRAKALLERWLRFSPRGLYFVARQVVGTGP